MNFSIKASSFVEGNTIHPPEKLREELGVIVGQFIKISGKETLVLEVGRAPKVGIDEALVSLQNFDRLYTGKDLDVEIPDVTLGCDPEFFVTWKSRFVYAATYLPGNGEIGCDGGLGELRPMYALHENGVANNLARLIPQIRDRMVPAQWARGLPHYGGPFDFQAHSYFGQLAAGFHIHLGIPAEMLRTKWEFRQLAVKHLVRCLDYFVSVPSIPLEVNHRRRLLRGEYGKAGDCRSSNSNLTLEYRTPGGFFLRTPALAKGLLGIALAVTETIVSRTKAASNNFASLDKLSKSDMEEMLPIGNPRRILKIMSSSDPKIAFEEVPSIIERLEKLPTYSKHKASIIKFFETFDKYQAPSPSLLDNWKGTE